MEVSVGKVGHLLGFKTDLRSGSQPKPDISSTSHTGDTAKLIATLWFMVQTRQNAGRHTRRTLNPTVLHHVQMRRSQPQRRPIWSECSLLIRHVSRSKSVLKHQGNSPQSGSAEFRCRGGRFHWLHRAETSHDVKTAQLHLWIKKRYRLRFRCPNEQCSDGCDIDGCGELETRV